MAVVHSAAITQQMCWQVRISTTKALLCAMLSCVQRLANLRHEIRELDQCCRTLNRTYAKELSGIPREIYLFMTRINY